MASSKQDQRFQRELEELHSNLNENIARTSQSHRRKMPPRPAVLTGIVGGIATMTTLPLNFIVQEAAS